MALIEDKKQLIISSCLCLLLTTTSSNTYGQTHQPFAPQSKWLYSAQEQFDQGMYANAIQSADKYIAQLDAATVPKRPPEKEKAYYVKAVAQLKLNSINCEEDAIAYIESTANPSYKQRTAYFLAQHLFKLNRLSDAAKYYEIASISNLNNDEIAKAKFELAYCYFNNNQFNQAEPLLASIKEIGGKYYDAGNYYYGLLAYNQGNYKEALKSFKEVVHNPDYSNIVPYYIAEIYYFLGNKDRALKDAKRLIAGREKSYYDNELHLLTGQIYFENEEYETALPYFQHFYNNTDRIRKEDLYEMAFCYYQVKDWNNAIKNFKQLSNTRDSLGQTSMYLLGDCYINIDDKKSARNAFGICADMPYNKEQKEAALLLTAKLSYELGYNSDAIYNINILLADFPNSKHTDAAKTLLSDLLIRTRNYPEAFAALEEVNTKGRRFNRIYQKVTYGYAMQQIQLGNNSFADSLLTMSINHATDNTYKAAAHFWKAELAYRANEYKSTIVFGNRFLSDKTQGKEWVTYLSPAATDRNMYTLLGYASMKLNQYDAAQTFFSKAHTGADISDSTFIASSLLKQADAVFMQKDYKTAIKLYDKVINSEDGDTDYALYQKAIILGLQDKSKQKVKILNGLISKTPRSKYANGARYELGLTYIEKDKYAKAISTLKPLTTAYEVRGLAPKAWMKIGFAYQQANSTSKAITAYKRVVEEYPGSEDRAAALDALKSLYIQAGQPEAYATMLKKNNLGDVEANILDSTYYATAETQYAENNWSNAARLLEEYLKKYPTGIFANKAHYYKAESYYQLGQYTKALKGYDAVLNNSWSNFSENSARRAAAITFGQKDMKKAKKYYATLRSMTLDQKTLNAAYNGMMLCSYKLNELGEAAAYADTLLSMPDINENMKYRALSYKAQSLKQTGDLGNALMAYNELTNAKINSIAAEARYNVAEIHFSNGSLEEAEASANTAIQQGGSDYWVVKSFLLIADILVQQEDYFNAKATLQSVIKNSKIEDLKKQAKKKLEKVTALEAQKSKLAE